MTSAGGADCDPVELDAYRKSMAGRDPDKLYGPDGTLPPVPPTSLGAKSLPDWWPNGLGKLIADSGISYDVYEARGYSIVNRTDAHKAGFSHKQSARASEDWHALLVPLWDVTSGDAPAGFQLRPSRPGHDGRKYETPLKQPNFLDVNPLMRTAVLDGTTELWVTEGVRKVDSLASVGVPCIGLTGVWNWRGRERPGDKSSPSRPLPQWDLVPLADRCVVICFDSDVDEKDDVVRARRQLAQWLASRGARVQFVTPPPAADGGKQGIDDFLGVGGGRLADLPRVVPDLADGDGRPVLLVNNSADVYDKLEAELGAGDLFGFFRRDGVLVHVPVIGEEGYMPPLEEDAHDGPAQVRPVTPTYLRATVQSRFYVAREMRNGSVRHVFMPSDLATVVVEAAGGWTNVPVVRTVAHTPLMRADGTLLTAAGYDGVSKTLLLPAPGLQLKDVPEPVPDHAVDWARKMLEYLLVDFPFTGDESRANALAMLVTPLLRHVVPPPYPLFIINAHQPGSGKTLLSQVATELHGGVTRTELPQNDDELRKQISGILATTTAPVVVWDNASERIKSPILAALLTDTAWNDRLLGSTKDIHATNDRIWLTTGNNVVIGGDMARRCYWIKLDPRTPRPELRSGFQQEDLIGYVRQDRGLILTALLVLARHWVEQGQPSPAVRSDSYRRWAGAMSEILRPMGLADAFARQTQEAVTQADDDDELGDLLAALAVKFGDSSFQVRECLDMASQQREALPAEVLRKFAAGGELSKVLGRYLARNQGRYAGGRRVSEAGDGRGGKYWRVETA
jgi:hypothetical protein